MSARRWLVRATHPVLRRWAAWRSRRTQRVRVDGLDLLVEPGVFHPRWYGSTDALVAYVATRPLRGRSFLELGAGTGRVALVAARAGAVVTASDVNPAAVANVRSNAARNGLPVDVVQSDLFDALPARFEVIVVNPPYYARDPRDDAERAFFAGATLGYFERLFPALAARVRDGAEVAMVLSGDLDRAPIAAIAARAGLALAEVARQVRWGEAQIVFAVRPSA